MAAAHEFAVHVEWTGSRGEGTSSYRAYGRQNLIAAEGKPTIAGSAARVFHGDPDRWNPEELLVAALSECHMLSYLHSAVRAGVTVTSYTDAATGTMDQVGDGGRFTEVLLRPRVGLLDESQRQLADSLHDQASENCFIASSVNFPVRHEPVLPG